MTTPKQMKERRDWLKSHGVCIQCGQSDAVRGYVRCGECIYKQQQYMEKYKKKHGKVDQSKQVKARKERLKIQGLCKQCGKRKIYRNSMCPECWAKEKVRRVKYYQKTNVRQEWREKGLCVQCGSEAIKPYKVCKTHLEIIRKAQKFSAGNEYWRNDNKIIFMKRG